MASKGFYKVACRQLITKDGRILHKNDLVSDDELELSPGEYVSRGYIQPDHEEQLKPSKGTKDKDAQQDKETKDK